MRRRHVSWGGLIGLGLLSWLLARPSGAVPTELPLPKGSMMYWTQGENIHIGNQEGAINRRANITISVELLDGNKLDGSVSGTRAEHNLFKSYSTNEETTWKERWSGRWVLAGGSLRLDLKLNSRECKKIKTATGAAPEKLACDKPSPRLHMECSTQQIDMEHQGGPPEAPVMKTSKQEVWACSPTDSGELGETPSRWVLSKQIPCVQVNPGRGGTTYRVCPPLGRGK